LTERLYPHGVNRDVHDGRKVRLNERPHPLI
jgi:hypothetical protein